MKDHQLKSYHTPDAIEERLKKGPSRSYLRDFIYGAIDGAVTTFAVVSGVAGARLSFGIVIILGFANVIADGFSMAISNFLGTRAEEQLIERARRREEHHIEMVPDGEREEIRQIYSKKGFDGDALERIVEVICADKKLWVDTMVTEEWGLSLESPLPWRAALVTFGAFVMIGILPLLPFILHTIYPVLIRNPFLWSALTTGIAFFTVGAFKSKLLELKWYKGGLETLLVGGSAAALAYLAGFLLKGLG
ncbi:MAG: VIT1/CCC1 transporter family protein [Chlamydiota bacterium]|nr:VIT1/CCC1 transporter family protein [Chlamydiota bacterium]